jgi:hypothetical protein
MKRPHLFCIVKKFLVLVGAAFWDQSEIVKIFILVTESQIALNKWISFKVKLGYQLCFCPKMVPLN